jgi:hypothetical protein
VQSKIQRAGTAKVLRWRRNNWPAGGQFLLVLLRRVAAATSGYQVNWVVGATTPLGLDVIDSVGQVAAVVAGVVISQKDLAAQVLPG